MRGNKDLAGEFCAAYSRIHGLKKYEPSRCRVESYCSAEPCCFDDRGHIDLSCNRTARLSLNFALLWLQIPYS